ncbi:MAG: DNA/RNA non-specific endonuclease [Eubacteriales bacterium]|nr:DNA/RNA non-specific endonuclease [Eubacteriales bacterium]
MAVFNPPLPLKSRKISDILFSGQNDTLKITGTKKKVTWKSSKTSVCTVTKAGKLTGKKAGKATITATVNKKKYKCTVKVYKPAAFSGKPYVVINGNKPEFTASQKSKKKSYEKYSALDKSGRCGMAISCVGKDIMPTEKRGAIGMVKPTGWQTVKYPKYIISDLYLYNRCHLLAYELTGENANTKNLITGTRYMNVDGMLPYENKVAQYVKKTGNHVIYRVTPIFAGSNLVVSGVHMEGYSVEDKGKGISFNIYCYNVQPGITINYKDGSSWNNGSIKDPGEKPEPVSGKYVLNENTKKFHVPSCGSVNQMAEGNRKYYDGSRDKLIADGYSPCGNCKP